MLQKRLVVLAGSVGLLACCQLSDGHPASWPTASVDSDGAAPDLRSGLDSGASVDGRSESDAASGGSVTTQLSVQNPSFELPALAPGTYSTSAPPAGWQAYGYTDNGYRATGVLSPSSTALYLDPVPDGNNVGVVFLLDRPMEPTYYASREAGLQQTLTETLLPNSEYTLLVDVGNINTDKSPRHPFDFAGFPNYRIDLLAGGQVLASDSNSLKPGEGRFLSSTVKYVTGNQHALSGLALGIRLVNLNSAVGTEVNFDNVRLARTTR